MDHHGDVAAQLLYVVYVRRFARIEPLTQTNVPMALIILIALFSTRGRGRQKEE